MKMHNHVYDDNTIINSNANDDLVVGPDKFPLTKLKDLMVYTEYKRVTEGIGGSKQYRMSKEGT